MKITLTELKNLINEEIRIELGDGTHINDIRDIERKWLSIPDELEKTNKNKNEEWLKKTAIKKQDSYLKKVFDSIKKAYYKKVEWKLNDEVIKERKTEEDKYDYDLIYLSPRKISYIDFFRKSEELYGHKFAANKDATSVLYHMLNFAEGVPTRPPYGFKVGNEYIAKDGNHTILAAVSLGINRIPFLLTTKKND